MVWRCGRAFSPGSRTCRLAAMLVVVPLAGLSFSGSTSCSTRRSTAAGVVIVMASSIADRTTLQGQRCGRGPPSRALCATGFSQSGRMWLAFQPARISSYDFSPGAVVVALMVVLRAARSLYTYSRAVSGFEALRRMGAGGFRIVKGAAHAIDQGEWIGRKLVPAPGHMAVPAQQHEWPLIERRKLRIGQR